ncbi:MAG: serine/threonine protein kinase [Polyangiales bacterium]
MRALRMGTMSGPALSQEPEEDPSLVEKVSGKYRCVLRLDSGGMAEVFLAVSQGVAGFNKLFVLKRLREALAENDEHRQMFLHEARLAARLNHPNVVQTYEVGEDGTGIFIAMEYLEGQPLSRLRRELVKQEVNVSQAIHARIVSEVLCGLHYAHELTDYDGTPLRIVHRDVSPQNVFITYDGQVKIVDFGIAKTHDSGTQAGIFKGKFAYTAPEQVRGESIDRRADVFTAGILLWELLTQHKLLAGDNPAQTFARLLTEPIPTVRSIAPAVDDRLEAIVMKALERNPANRYQTAQAMRDALEEFLVASSQTVRQDQISKLLGDLFRAERTRVQKAIKEELAGFLHSPSSSRVVAAPRIAVNGNGDDSVSLRAHGSLPALRTLTLDDGPEIEIAPSSREAPKKRAVYLGVALIAVGALIYTSARRDRGAPAANAAVETPVSPATTAAAPPTTPNTGSAVPSPAPIAPAAPVAEPPKVVTKWVAPPKKTTSTASSPAAPTPSPVAAPAPTQAPAAESSAKEKRKFRTDF